jgi:hypothetical protein
MKTSGYIFLLAWTLWIRTQGLNLDSWTQMSGFAGQKQCADNVDEKLETWRRFKDAKFSGTTVSFADTKTSMTYLCLPDNEDPREVKAQKPAKKN